MENESPVEDFEEVRVVRTELEAALRTNRKTTRLKQLTVQTNRKRESKFRSAGKYHLPFIINCVSFSPFFLIFV